MPRRTRRRKETEADMKIAFLEPLGISHEVLKGMVYERLGDAVEAVYYPDRSEDPEELVKRSAGAECVVISNLRFGRDVISRLPELKYLCVAFTGMDLVDLEYCAQAGIRVKNCAGYSTAAVADLVFGFIIMLARNLIPCDAAARSGGTKAGLVGWELEGKKLGVIGAGAIGTRVLKIAQAFGCETYAYSRTVKEIPGVQFVSMEELMKTCDIVSVHVPQTKETVGLVSRGLLSLMKPTAVLINTARGPVVDGVALAELLNAGKIAGAGIDVFDREPPLDPEDPLLHAKNCIVSPHVGFAAEQAFVKRAAIVCDNIRSWIG